MKSTIKRFNYRAFVGLVMTASGFALPVSGLANHFYEFAPMGLVRHAWMSAHNTFGFLFVVFGIWHVALNWPALRSHIKGGFERLPSLGREFLFAGGIVAVALLFVGHVFLA